MIDICCFSPSPECKTVFRCLKRTGTEHLAAHFPATHRWSKGWVIGNCTLTTPEIWYKFCPNLIQRLIEVRTTNPSNAFDHSRWGRVCRSEGDGYKIICACYQDIRSRGSSKNVRLNIAQYAYFECQSRIWYPFLKPQPTVQYCC